MAKGFGYQYGQPFGNPAGFTGNTQDSEIDRFNQWMRSQPWWSQAAKPGQDNSDAVTRALHSQGVPISDDMEVDATGNLHKQGHALRNALIAAGIGAGAFFGGPAVLGMFGAGGAGAGAGAAVGETAGLDAAGMAALPGTVEAATVGATGAGAAGAGAAGMGSGLTDILKQLGNRGVDDLLNGGGGPNPLTQLSSTLGNTSAARANGRLQQALLDLQRAGLTLKAPEEWANQSVRGDILSNLQDVHITPPAGIPMGTISGGLRPSLLSPTTRQFGKNMTQNALLAQMKAGPPTIPDLPSPNALDTTLNAGAAGTGIAGAIANFLPQKGAPGYDPWSDPQNYDENGQFIGPGAWDDSGMYMGNGSDPFGG